MKDIKLIAALIGYKDKKAKEDKETDIKKYIGGGYDDYIEFKGRYRVCKGSRASKKSKTTALDYINKIIKNPTANLLVVRKTYRTLKDSCFTELKWAINRLGLDKEFDYKLSPLEMTYKPTGQKIFFRGLDDPLKITSISAEVGSLCWMWIEEAYEIEKESDFDMLDESIRGETESGVYKQITVTLNPWNERHWIKKRFFDVEKCADIMAKTTNYMCNEFLDAADRALFERMKKQNPRRYQVAGLGEWGIIEGLVYENWEEKFFDYMEISSHKGVKSIFGLDFGYTNDPTALFCGLIDTENKEIWVFDEIYKKAMTNTMIYAEIAKKGYAKERIVADSASPKDIDNLRELGLKKIVKSRKGKDSIRNGIQFIQDYRIYIHPRCNNFIAEISNYTWKTDKNGNKINEPVDKMNHLLDAMRYGAEVRMSRTGAFIRNKRELGF